MSLDVRVMEMLDRYAYLDAEDAEKDKQALEYINGIPVSTSTLYLRNEYKKYYFKAKRDYKEEQQLNEDMKGYGI